MVQALQDWLNTYLGKLLLAIAVAWSTAVSQALFYTEWPRSPLLTLGPVTFWREGALQRSVLPRSALPCSALPCSALRRWIRHSSSAAS